MYDIALKHGHVYLDGGFKKTNVYIKDGIIACITDAILDANDAVDITGKELFPGLIDPHVHFDLDLGFIRSKDDFVGGSKAALFGGVTTVIDFLEPTRDKDALLPALKRRLNEAKDTYVDVKFHACIANPKGDLKTYVKTMKSLGLNTLKLFTTYSESNRRTENQAIETLLTLSKSYDFLLLAHIEADDMIDLNPEFKAKDLPLSRPKEAEVKEALNIAEMVEKTQGYLYMVHCSSGTTIESLKARYPTLLNQHMFVESCPQYFTFTNDHLTGINGHLYTCAPPLRSQAEQDLLASHIADFETIGTDHCAFNAADKDTPYLKDMPLGIGSIEQSFQIMYTKFGLKMIDKMSKNVANRFKLEKKGQIKVGYEADLFVYEKSDTKINPPHGHTDYNLYKDLPVNGQIIHTIKSGQFAVKNQTLCKTLPKGRWLSS